MTPKKPRWDRPRALARMDASALSDVESVESSEVEAEVPVEVPVEAEVPVKDDPTAARCGRATGGKDQ